MFKNGKMELKVCRWTLIVLSTISACVVYSIIYLLLVGPFMGRGLKAAVAGSREHTHHNLPLVTNLQRYQVRTSDGEWRACNVTGGVFSSCDHDYLDGDKPFVAVVDNQKCGGYGACKGDIVCQGGYHKSGGEFRACERLVIMINHHGYDVVFFTEIEFAVEYFQQLLHRKKPRIVLVSNRGKLDKIPSVEKDGVNRPLSPFSEQCLLFSHYWGAGKGKNPELWLWPGGLSRVVTPFPKPGNTFVGSKVDLCQRDDLRPSGNVSKEDNTVPVSVQSSTRQLMIGDQGEPYALLIGKWESTGKIDQIHETFKKKRRCGTISLTESTLLFSTVLTSSWKYQTLWQRMSFAFIKTASSARRNTSPWSSMRNLFWGLARRLCLRHRWKLSHAQFQ